MKRKEYEIPRMDKMEVELEKGFMKASVFEDGKENASGVTIEEHGFADSTKDWEGDYSNDGWD